MIEGKYLTPGKKGWHYAGGAWRGWEIFPYRRGFGGDGGEGKKGVANQG